MDYSKIEIKKNLAFSIFKLKKMADSFKKMDTYKTGAKGSFITMPVMKFPQLRILLSNPPWVQKNKILEGARFHIKCASNLKAVCVSPPIFFLGKDDIEN